MKTRKFIITCSTLFLVSLISIGCGKTKYNASDKALSCANQAIEIGHQYLDGDKSADEAKDKLERLCSAMSYAEKYTYEEKEDDKQKFADSSIQFYIFILRNSISNDSGILGDTKSFNDVKEDVEKLEELVDEYD